MLDDKELQQIIIDQNERISKLEEEVKHLSFRVDNLEANPSGTIDNILGVTPTFTQPAANRAQGTSATGPKNGIMGLLFD